MTRLLAAFVALFVVALGCLALMPKPPRSAASGSGMVERGSQNAESVVAAPKIRVVYPASGVDLPQPLPAMSTGGDAREPPAATAQAVAVYPQLQGTSSPTSNISSPANPAVQAGQQGIDLNTASIDALNRIPGAGHIGRTIASHRPYRSVEDLLAKHVIRKSVYDRIKAQVAAE